MAFTKRKPMAEPEDGEDAALDILLVGPPKGEPAGEGEGEEDEESERVSHQQVLAELERDVAKLRQLVEKM